MSTPSEAERVLRLRQFRISLITRSDELRQMSRRHPHYAQDFISRAMMLDRMADKVGLQVQAAEHRLLIERQRRTATQNRVATAVQQNKSKAQPRWMQPQTQLAAAAAVGGGLYGRAHLARQAQQGLAATPRLRRQQRPPPPSPRGGSPLSGGLTLARIMMLGT